MRSLYKRLFPILALTLFAICIFGCAAATVKYRSMKFFESGYRPPEKSKRHYTSRFAKRNTRYVFYEIYLKNELWKKRENPVKIMAKYYKPDGSLMGKPVLDYTIPSDWEYAYLWHGWGWHNSGNWAPGTYRVEIFICDEKCDEKADKVAEQFFSVNIDK